MARGIELLLLVAMLCTWQAAGARDSGSEAPNFALKALDGRNYRLSEMRGSVVLLSFGASWCGPCRSQLSTLQEFHERYHGAGLAVLGVNLDEHDREAAVGERAASKVDRDVLSNPNRQETEVRLPEL